MKPFDLEKALAGEPVVTRDGRPVIISGHNPNEELAYPVQGWIEGVQGRIGGLSWRESGRFVDDDEFEDPLDLFMAPKKQKAWINLYRLFNGKIITPIMYSSEDEAKANGITNKPIATIPIEWEE